MPNNTNQTHQISIHLGNMPVIFDHIQNGIVITNSKVQILYTNPSYSKITGYTKQETLGGSPGMIHSGRHDKEFYKSMWDKIINNGFWEGEIWNRRKTGEIYAEYLTISKLELHQSDDFLYIGIFSDITYLKKDIKQKLHLAYYDPLTELPNRNLFMDRAKTTIENANDKTTAIFFMDLDHFKQANDTYGHCVGDQLLHMVGERMKTCIRAGDTIARIGGDEFTAILPSLSDKKVAMDVAKRITDKIEKPFIIDGNTINIAISVGITFYPTDSTDFETLLIHADKAMYMAKESGSKTECFDAIKDKI